MIKRYTCTNCKAKLVGNLSKAVSIYKCPVCHYMCIVERIQEISKAKKSTSSKGTPGWSLSNTVLCVAGVVIVFILIASYSASGSRYGGGHKNYDQLTIGEKSSIRTEAYQAHTRLVIDYAEYGRRVGSGEVSNSDKVRICDKYNISEYTFREVIGK